MKSNDNVVREYVRRLNDDDLRWLSSRFGQMFGGDRGEAVQFISENREMDRWLNSAVDSEDLFEALDQIGEGVQKEYNRRFSKH